MKPIRAYQTHRGHAKARGIPWELTYLQWRIIWAVSGHWRERGRKRGQYVMARFGDIGPYAVGNVKIIQVGENVSEAQRGWPEKRDSDKVESHKRKTSKTLSGRTLSKEHRQHISEAGVRRWKRIKVGH